MKVGPSLLLSLFLFLFFPKTLLAPAYPVYRQVPVTLRIFTGRGELISNCVTQTIKNNEKWVVRFPCVHFTLHDPVTGQKRNPNPAVDVFDSKQNSRLSSSLPPRSQGSERTLGVKLKYRRLRVNICGIND